MRKFRRTEKLVKVNCAHCNIEFNKAIRFIKTKSEKHFCCREHFVGYKIANPKICSVEGCNEKRVGDGLCSSHFEKQPKRKEKNKKLSLKRYERVKQKREEDPEFDISYREQKREEKKASGKKYRDENREELKRKAREDRKRPKRRYDQLVSQCKVRHIDCNISFEEWSSIIYPGVLCYYGCGNPVAETGSGLDRLNCDVGYTKENCVPCCKFCNILKGTLLSEEEQKAVVETLKNLRKVDNIWENSKYLGQTDRPGKRAYKQYSIIDEK